MRILVPSIPLGLLLWSASAFSQSITVAPEPFVGGKLRYLPMAPATSGGTQTVQISVGASITNTERTKSLHLNKVAVDFPGSSATGFNDPADVTIAAHATKPWPAASPSAGTTDRIVLSGTAPSSIRIRFYFDGFVNPVAKTYTLGAYVAGTPTGANRFWGRVADLQPDEFWAGSGATHGLSQNGCQLFAYDVNVNGWDPAVGDWTVWLPGKSGTANSDFRIWGKPIYAVASGTVLDFRPDHPTNATPGTVDTPPPGLPDGNGNFFMIDDGVETTLYAHMQPFSLNPALTSKGAHVNAGDFLGLAGNSGNSFGPHLHIGAMKSPWNITTQWLRPFPLDTAFAIDNAALKSNRTNVGLGAWVQLIGKGIPNASGGAPYSLLWPSSARPVNLSVSTASDFFVQPDGIPWVLTTDAHLRVSSDQLHDDYATGVFLNVDSSGIGSAVTVSGTTPWLIGTDNRAWRKLSSGWSVTQTAGSGAMRITTDPVTGTVWIIGLDRLVYSFNATTGTWTQLPGGGSGKDLAVYNGAKYLIGEDDTIYRNTGSGWFQLPQLFTPKRLVVDGASGKLWAIGMNDGVFFQADDGTWTEYPQSGRAKRLRVRGGRPYVVGLDDGLWKGVGPGGWQRLNMVQPK